MRRQSLKGTLPSGSVLELRRLRFADPALEHAFRDDYAEKARRQVRFIMAVLLPVVQQTHTRGGRSLP